MHQFLKRLLLAVWLALAAMAGLVLVPGQPALLTAVGQSVPIRRIEPVAIATQVYQQLPTLPLENQYLSRQDGQPALEDTLVSRMIRYHLYVKSRAPNGRLDWKLTIADYLGAFEHIRPASYPSADTLTVNPLEGDQAALAGLSRQQRNALVEALLESLTANGRTAASGS
jgi:hypothetical protein